MVEEIDELMDKFKDVLKQLPPVKIDKEKLDLNIPYETCVCGKQVLASAKNLEELDTGVFKTLNDVCRGCEAGKKIDRENARIVCGRCKRIICRMEPHKDPVSGFVYKAGKTYHLESCALCNPDPDGKQVPYKIIEVTLWNKMRNK